MGGGWGGGGGGGVGVGGGGGGGGGWGGGGGGGGGWGVEVCVWSVYWFHSVSPFFRPYVRPESPVRPGKPTVLVRSISYLYILSSNFRRCVACVKSFAQFRILGIFFLFVTLTLSCFDLGSDVNH